jgi:hypothetical protein
MRDTIKVHVVKYPDRDNLMMRYRDPYTGRHVARSTGTTKHGEAVKLAAKWEDDLHNGRFKSPSRVTCEEFRDKYESEVLSGLAKNTDTKVSGVFDSVETIINPERVRDITSERLSYYVAKQRKAGLADRRLPATSPTYGRRSAMRSSGDIWQNSPSSRDRNGREFRR